MSKMYKIVEEMMTDNSLYNMMTMTWTMTTYVDNSITSIN